MELRIKIKLTTNEEKRFNELKEIFNVKTNPKVVRKLIQFGKL